MGIVRAIQKGEAPAGKFSKAAQKAAKSMKKSSVRKYAKTKHDDLPKKVKEEKKRDYKAEYKKFQSSTKMKKYRAELNKYNRKKGTYGNGDGKDASHKGGKIVGFESQSKNRGRAEKSRLKKESVNEAKYTHKYTSITAMSKDYDRIFGSTSAARVKIVAGSKREATGKRSQPAYITIEGDKKLIDAYKKIAFNGKGKWTDVLKSVKESVSEMVPPMSVSNPAAYKAMLNKQISKNAKVKTALANKKHKDHNKARSIVKRFMDKFRKKESVNEANNIDKIKDIVKNKQYKRIGGVIIDMQTANAIMKVHKALTGANKKKYEKLSISKMASIAYKLIK